MPEKKIGAHVVVVVHLEQEADIGGLVSTQRLQVGQCGACACIWSKHTFVNANATSTAASAATVAAAHTTSWLLLDGWLVEVLVFTELVSIVRVITMESGRRSTMSEGIASSQPRRCIVSHPTRRWRAVTVVSALKHPSCLKIWIRVLTCEIAWGRSVGSAVS